MNLGFLTAVFSNSNSGPKFGATTTGKLEATTLTFGPNRSFDDVPHIQAPPVKLIFAYLYKDAIAYITYMYIYV